MIEIKVASRAASTWRSSWSASDRSILHASCELGWPHRRAGSNKVTCIEQRSMGEQFDRQVGCQTTSSGHQELAMATVPSHEEH